MRITGNGKEIDILYIEHKGVNETFIHHADYAQPIMGESIKRPEECLIEFSDIHEIDDLIEMLNEVKNECEEQMRHWNLSKKGRSNSWRALKIIKKAVCQTRH